jgi:sensor c-di-GMP phosphodiesterase-like protein
VQLAIDDFGTGYSSLGYLHAFQIDELKIDRSFAPGSDGVDDAHVLSQAIVELGRALRLDMIAEGIETADQADWFRSLGIRLGQGFHFARPLSGGDLERYLRHSIATPGGAAGGSVSGGQLGRSARLRGAGITDVLGARKAAG